jgi:hypothetical protein
VPSSTAASACERLCVSAPITIIRTIPFVSHSTKRIFGGQPSVGAMPRSYQVTPKVLGRRRATKASVGQINDDTELWSQPAASPRTNRIRRTSFRLDPSDDDTDGTLCVAM